MREHEIRPINIFDEYLRLAKIDAKEYFENAAKIEINCPSCDNPGVFTFEKNNFKYCQCSECLNLYVNPRPELKAFTDYYTNSPSAKYWATTFYKKTEKQRREKIWKPKAQLIKNILKKLKSETFDIIDIGGGYGTFAEELRKILDNNIIIIEPGKELADVCRKKGFKVKEDFLENIKKNDIPRSKKCFVSFELFEHLHSPKFFLDNLNSLMEIGDIFIFTTLSSTGLDIQLLWENSPSVSPPHHLNFFNPKSAEIILEKMGFKVIELSTPGKLDVDIILNNKKHIKDRFWINFLETSNDTLRNDLQIFLSKNKLSSHMMIAAVKI